MEIKFRVFDKISKQMYRWSQIASISLVDFDKEHYELMQFTGLKDKNGKKIYNGDIVSFCGNKPVQVKFENGCFTVFGEPLGWDFDNFDDGVRNPIKCDLTLYCEIVGNIYENPELLNKKEL